MNRNDLERQSDYRDLFQDQLNSKAVDDIRFTLDQNQPLGNTRFSAKIEAITGQKQEAKPQGRPRVQHDETLSHSTVLDKKN